MLLKFEINWCEAVGCRTTHEQVVAEINFKTASRSNIRTSVLLPQMGVRRGDYGEFRSARWGQDEVTTDSSVLQDGGKKRKLRRAHVCKMEVRRGDYGELSSARWC